MEDGRNKEPKTTTEDDANSPDPAEETRVSRPARSYDCIYCRRGFTTAQALGGHMNIHRKDRSRMRRNQDPPFQQKTDEYPGPGYNRHYSSYLNPRAIHPPPPEPPKHHTTYFPASSSAGTDDIGLQRERRVSRYGDDLQLGLGMHSDSTRGDQDEEEKGKDELDLELRLGHEP